MQDAVKLAPQFPAVCAFVVIQDDVFARRLTFPNVIITGHQRFFTEEALRNIAETTLTNITSFEQGMGLMHEVSIEQVVTGDRRREAT